MFEFNLKTPFCLDYGKKIVKKQSLGTNKEIENKSKILRAFRPLDIYFFFVHSYI